MAYIGKTPQVGAYQKCDALTASATADYTLQVGSSNVSPESVNHMIVSLNGVIQQPTTAYTVAGAVLSFNSALTSNDTIDFVILLGNVLDIGTPSDDTVATAKIQDDAVTAAKINTDLISGTTALASEPADTDEFLVSDAGTLKRLDYSLIKGGGAWNFIKSQTASDVASVEFINGTSDVVLDSTYVMYKLIAYDVTVATDDSNSNMYFSTDAGSSYITSGYDTVIARGRSDTFSGNNTETGSALWLNSLGNDASTEGAAFEFMLVNPSNAKYTRYWFTGTTRDHSSRMALHYGGGMLETAGDVDAIKILQTAGNISGTFKLYGLSGS